MYLNISLERIPFYKAILSYDGLKVIPTNQEAFRDWLKWNLRRNVSSIEIIFGFVLRGWTYGNVNFNIMDLIWLNVIYHYVICQKDTHIREYVTFKNEEVTRMQQLCNVLFDLLHMERKFKHDLSINEYVKYAMHKTTCIWFAHINLHRTVTNPTTNSKFVHDIAQYQKRRDADCLNRTI